MKNKRYFEKNFEKNFEKKRENLIFRRDEGGIIDAEGKGRAVLFCAG